MISDNIKDNTRYVVNGCHYGGIIPSSKSEIYRNIYLQSGAEIKGGIYGNNLFINGSSINVEGAVHCLGSIKFTDSTRSGLSDINFHSTVSCSNSILAINNSKLRFLSDIYSDKINIKNCIIYGNLYSTSAIIEDCIVLGGIYCRNELTIKNSIFFTFRSKKCNIEDNNSILSPFGFAETIKLDSFINVLIFSNIFSDKVSNLGGCISLDNSDIYNIELEQVDDKISSSAKTIQVLSIAERLLNTKEIISNFKENRNFIEFLSLNSHLSQEKKYSFSANRKEQIEKKLWQIIDEKKTFKELKGFKSIQEMFKVFSNGKRNI